MCHSNGVRSNRKWLLPPVVDFDFGFLVICSFNSPFSLIVRVIQSQNHYRLLIWLVNSIGNIIIHSRRYTCRWPWQILYDPSVSNERCSWAIKLYSVFRSFSFFFLILSLWARFFLLLLLVNSRRMCVIHLHSFYYNCWLSIEMIFIFEWRWHPRYQYIVIYHIIKLSIHYFFFFFFLMFNLFCFFLGLCHVHIFSI